MTDTTTAPQTTTAIQCLLRRKGGTQVAFGHNQSTQVNYDFQPLDSKKPNSPHVCQVADDEHLARFLAIPEAYRLYRAGDAAVTKIAVTKPVNNDDGAFKNRFDDILSINFETAENDTVTAWAKEVLELTTAHSAKIKQKAANLDVTVKKGDTMTEALRNIGTAMQAEEMAASDQANNDK